MLSAIDESAIVINSADEEGWAPLHSAASIGNLEIVEVLLSRGRIFFFFFFFCILYLVIRVVFGIIVSHVKIGVVLYTWSLFGLAI